MSLSEHQIKYIDLICTLRTFQDPVSLTSISSEIPADEQLKDEKRKTRRKVKREQQNTSEDSAKR